MHVCLCTPHGWIWRASSPGVWEQLPRPRCWYPGVVLASCLAQCCLIKEARNKRNILLAYRGKILIKWRQEHLTEVWFAKMLSFKHKTNLSQMWTMYEPNKNANYIWICTTGWRFKAGWSEILTVDLYYKLKDITAPIFVHFHSSTLPCLPGLDWSEHLWQTYSASATANIREEYLFSYLVKPDGCSRGKHQYQRQQMPKLS